MESTLLKAEFYGGPCDGDLRVLQPTVWASGVLHIPSSPVNPLVHPWYRDDDYPEIAIHVYRRSGGSVRWFYHGIR